MKSLIFAALVGLSPLAQDGKLYEHTPTNFKFKIAGESKLVKKKGDWTITFPLQDGKGEATLQVFAVSFMADPEVWEGSQKYFAQQTRMLLISQTREEILGVPLFLSKMQETETPARRITLSGLIYSMSEFKLAFRLSASEDMYPLAEEAWRSSLQTFATIDGQMPKAETPGRTAEAPATKRKPLVIPEGSRVSVNESKKTDTVTIGETKAELTTGGYKVKLCGAKEWTFKTSTEGVISATHPEFGQEIVVQVASSLDSPPMKQALLNRSGKLLDLFKFVRLRQETPLQPNIAGSKCIRIVREGEGAEGPLVIYQAGGEKGDSYWTLEFQSKSRLTGKQLDAYQLLVSSLSVEPNL